MVAHESLHVAAARPRIDGAKNARQRLAEVARSLANLTRVELGFNPADVVTARASLQDSDYTGTAAAAGLFRTTLDAI